MSWAYNRLHEVFFLGLYAHQEPPAQRADWVPVVCLLGPSFSGVGELFPPGSLTEHSGNSGRITPGTELDRALWGLAERPVAPVRRNCGLLCSRGHGVAGGAMVQIA